MQGAVVGINTAIVPQGQGIGFAIPIKTAMPLIPQLVSTGSVTRGYLGVRMQTLTPALISEVVPGSPAEQAGLQTGDVLLTFADTAVESPRALAAIVAATPVGHEVSATLLRHGSKKTISLTVGRMPSPCC